MSKSVTRRTLLKAAPPAGIALLAAKAAFSEPLICDPVIGLLARHRLSLHEETSEWRTIERDVSSTPPQIHTREGAIECLRTALRVDNMGSFETALVSSALAFLER